MTNKRTINQNTSQWLGAPRGWTDVRGEKGIMGSGEKGRTVEWAQRNRNSGNGPNEEIGINRRRSTMQFFMLTLTLQYECSKFLDSLVKLKPL